MRIVTASVCALGLAMAAGALPVPNGAAITAQAVNQPDVIGGYSSSNIMVIVRPGVSPTVVDGRPTFTAGGVGNASVGLDAVMARFGVTAIVPTFDPPPANRELAQRFALDRSYIVRVPRGSDTPGLVRELSQFGELIEVAELDGIISHMVTPNDTNYNLQYGLHNTGQTIQGVVGTADADIDAPEAWAITTGVNTIRVAVLDTGISQTHPDLSGKVVLGRNWSTADANAWNDPTNGHGTHCAGIIAANTNNAQGIAGVAWNVRLMAGKVLGDGGGGQWTWVTAGMIWAADNAADVISMSLGGGADPGVTVLNAVNYAHAAGSTLIAAAGNANGGAVSWPARYVNTIAVSSTDNRDLRSGFSSRGPEVDVSAPGTNVYSTYRSNGYGYLSGTSMATPHVAGVAALVLSKNSTLTPDQVRTILQDSAEDRGPVGFDNDFGWGRVNARRALDLTPSPCTADWNGSGAVDVNDFFAYVADYSANAPRADINGGGVDVSDFFAFLSVYAGGC